MKNSPYIEARRVWINQPSANQPYHKYHGMNFLALPYTDTHSTIYFLGPNLGVSSWTEGSEGGTVMVEKEKRDDCISMVIHNMWLSRGWRFEGKFYSDGHP